MSNKKNCMSILPVKKHPDSLTNDNFFTRDDAVVINNARNALEMKQGKQVSRITNQLKRFLADNKT